jgi:hypothetical protein
MILKNFKMKLIIFILLISLTSLVGCIDEDDNWEVAAEWINYYGLVGKQNLSYRDDCAIGFYDHISSQSGWTGKFIHGNFQAWEEHWKRFDLDGEDYMWVDTADIAYFSGHGCGSTGLGRGDCVTFGLDANDDWILQATPSQREPRWGDTDLEWVVLDCCSALAALSDGDNVIHSLTERWANSNVMDGLHYILGFRTIATDSGNRGGYFAEYLTGDRDGTIYTIRNAWILATQDSESSSVFGAYLRTKSPGCDTLNDHLWGFGDVSDDPNPSEQSYRWHSWPCN